MTNTDKQPAKRGRKPMTEEEKAAKRAEREARMSNKLMGLVEMAQAFYKSLSEAPLASEQFGQDEIDSLCALDAALGAAEKIAKDSQEHLGPIIGRISREIEMANEIERLKNELELQGQELAKANERLRVSGQGRGKNKAVVQDEAA